MKNLKIIVAGMINADKSTFVDRFADIAVVSLTNPPRRHTEEEIGSNLRRELATEIGHIIVDDDLTLDLHSVASNLSSVSSIPRGMHGFVVLIDSTDERSFYEGRALLLYMAHFPSVPFMVVANKQDLEGALSVEQVRQKMRLIDRIPVIGCDARERDSVRNVLIELLDMILET